MTTYRITCTEQDPQTQDSQHARVVAVMTADKYGASPRRWTVDEVVEAMVRGDSFYVEREPGGVRAEVGWVDGGPQVGRYLRSHADGRDPNNLNSLPRCK